MTRLDLTDVPYRPAAWCTAWLAAGLTMGLAGVLGGCASSAPRQRLMVAGQYGRTGRFREVDPTASPFTIDTLLGVRQLSDQDRWQGLDSQPEIGVSVQVPVQLDDPTTVIDERTGFLSVLNYDFGVRYAFDRSNTSIAGNAVDTLDSKTFDLSAGLLLSPFQHTGRFQPYLGGGIAFVFVDTDLRSGDLVQSDRDTVLTSYIRSGALIEFAYGRHVGIDARWLSNANVMIDGLGADIGALTVSLVFGAQF